MLSSAAPPKSNLKSHKNKRQIMATLSSTPNEHQPHTTTNDTATTTINPKDMEQWAQTMNREFEQRLQRLRDDCETEKNQQKQVFAASMVKMPRKVKNMTIAEFAQMYNVNLLENIKVPNSATVAASTKSAAPKPPVAPSSSTMATPAPRSYAAQKKQLNTPSRTMRKGETLYSENGSPIESDGAMSATAAGALIASVTKPSRNGAQSRSRLLATSNAASLALNVGNGQSISLQDPSNMTQLGQDQKDSTILQLQLLKEQVDSALQQLQN